MASCVATLNSFFIIDGMLISGPDWDLQWLQAKKPIQRLKDLQGQSLALLASASEALAASARSSSLLICHAISF